jgi:hypothetical protein
MRTQLIDRRDFLAAAGIGFLASLAPRRLHAFQRSDAVFASAFQRRDGAYGVAVMAEDGRMLHALDLPERGHDVTFCPVTGRAVVFARQPGTFAVVFDPAGKQEPLAIASVEGRHFFGHGVFSPDGALLYATENDFDNAAGMIGIYDTQDNFRRIGEFPTYGVGPHEVLLMEDGRTLAIANGGIETHPDFGRAMLNLSTMEPSLVFVDRISGDLVGKCALPANLHQLSIRHMAPDAQGRIWFGCQYQGAQTDLPLLVGHAARDGAIALVDMPEKLLRGFRNYIGSVASNPDAGLVAVTSPEGNRLAVLDAPSGAVKHMSEMVEVCGIAPEGEGFRSTTGLGHVTSGDGRGMDAPDIVWDNHLLALG